jgi:6,7-dimethyl-8-ribityllumazine synthase
MATAQFTLPPIPYSLETKKLKIGIVVANWNSHITYALRDGAIDFLIEHGLKNVHIKTIEVPGSFELSLAGKWLLKEGYDAVICLGCIIQGDTPHFDYVCKAVTDGVNQIGLESNKPAIFGVLTTLTEEQALDRAGGKLGNKGEEAAHTALWMLAVKQNF